MSLAWGILSPCLEAISIAYLLIIVERTSEWSSMNQTPCWQSRDHLIAVPWFLGRSPPRSIATAQFCWASCVGLCLQVSLLGDFAFISLTAFLHSFCINVGVLLFGSPTCQTHLHAFERNHLKSWICRPVSFIKFLCTQICWTLF